MAVVFFVLLTVSVTVATVGFLGLSGRLPRNGFAGIRTRYTMASDERWMAVHRYAAPWMIFGGVGLASASLAFLPFALAGRIPDALGIAVAGAVALGTLFVVVLAATAGIRTARREGV